MKLILSEMNKSYTGSTLARIAVEVGEEEDVRLLVQSGTVDWNETSENEDPAILWALKNDKLEIADLLVPVSHLNFEGDSSADLTIICDSEKFLVHKYFLCYRSLVFNAMLNSPMKEANEGEICIQDMDPDTVSSMIHYIYTGEMSEDWHQLHIPDLAIAADMYDLPGWLELLCSELRAEQVVLSEDQFADIAIAGDTSDIARQLQQLAIDKS